jgi:archaeal type IV pilus assembly protein PilA
MRTAKRSAGRWRKSGKRGVSPIIATILLVAITVVLAAVLYVLISGLTRGPGNTPIGSAMAVGSGTGSQGTKPVAWYNETFSVQSASSGLAANDLKFQLVNSAGGIAAVTGAVSLIDVSGCTVNSYALGGTWAATAAVPASPAGLAYLTLCSNGLTVASQISSGDQLVLSTTSAISGQGYSLNIIGTGSYSGSISASVP